MPAKLYIIATPIGNLGDITLRALETLKSVDLILCEDTRITRRLLSHYDIDTPTLSYHQHSSDSKKLQILNKLLNGQSLVLVTDAGTPGLSDPGNELINFIAEKTTARHQHVSRLADPALREPTKERKSDVEQIIVTAVPGPSALTTAISVSGFNMSQFLFLGYFPKKKKSHILELISKSQIPLVYFDSPHRLPKNLALINDKVGDRSLFLARELTKLHEELFRGTISQYLAAHQTTPKGELVVIISHL